jgi:hypothetical protein
MLRKQFLIGFIVSCCTLVVQGQNAEDSLKSGKVAYHLAPGVNQLMEKYKRANYNSQGPEGYRVQIFTDAGTNAKERANNTLSEFTASFSGTPAYLVYQQPNFKVRCGDFLTKAQARKLQKRIDSQFPGSYIVRDLIKN